MTDNDDFLAWVKSVLYEAEVAVHNGDAGSRVRDRSRVTPA
jgi:hypothetical protein